MHIVVGLGNPGREYQRTRHNIGFMCVERFAERIGLRFTQRKANAEIASGMLDGESVLIAKPQTFMNDSGRSVASLVKFYKAPIENLIVVYDELDLPAGRIRLKPFGGHGGHNGMRSIVSALGGNQGFPRIRVGIGRPPGAGAANPDIAARYVLSPFRPDEQDLVEQTVSRVSEALETWVREGLEPAMNQLNTPSGAANGGSQRQSAG
ncbi:MAG TPA: aminoacyl-tRNA hydrolase [Planctomycetaceae bacterium]